jgi:hypothetical protein
LRNYLETVIYKWVGIRPVQAAVTFLLLSSLAAAAAGRMFRGEFDPVAFDSSTRADVVGAGVIAGLLDGGTLTITGHFSGLASPAMAAQLHMGAAMGVPGPAIGTLSVTHSVAGEISGKLSLNAAQLAALENHALYVRLDSVKAPGGTLWCWLEGGL